MYYLWYKDPQKVNKSCFGGSNGIQANRSEFEFADLAVAKSLEHNRSLKMMEKINDVVEWDNIEAVLDEHYEVGSSKEGADAFPPLLLMRCMLLQKWFRIPSDPELENQTNDMISFKKFLSLSLDRPSPEKKFKKAVHC